MRPEPQKPATKKPYRPPRVRSERILVPDLFTPSNCDLFNDPRPECQ
jgi:hypothetical protein